MDDYVPHQIDKIHKLEACFGIPGTAWSGDPWMINGIVYGRVSGKDGGANSLAPAASGMRYAVALGIGTLLV